MRLKPAGGQQDPWRKASWTITAYPTDSTFIPTDASTTLLLQELPPSSTVLLSIAIYCAQTIGCQYSSVHVVALRTATPSDR